MLFNTRTYAVDRVQPDSVAYAGPAKSLTNKDDLVLSRVYPKPTSAFAGVAKPSAKLTKTVVTNSTLGTTADAIVRFEGSLPVGISNADVDALLADFASWLATADAKSLFKTLDINA